MTAESTPTSAGDVIPVSASARRDAITVTSTRAHTAATVGATPATASAATLTDADGGGRKSAGIRISAAPKSTPHAAASPSAISPATATDSVGQRHARNAEFLLYCSGSCSHSRQGITPSGNPAQDAERNARDTTRPPGSPGAKRTKTTEVTQAQR